MKKLFILIFAVLVIVPQLSFAEKIAFKKVIEHRKKLKIHPLQKIFDKTPKHISKSNKLLCILVDFQKDDNPLTTGDGKFLTKNDATNYPITLGKPPHDYNFYLQHLRALKYYYLAASFGALNLHYDLFPKPESSITAYTLPHQMDYYNPANASQDLRIERFEEYFHDIFTEADKDNDIHFADYGHFMVIHAGSDWQHDVNGDTPSDIPSFFIRISDDKKVWVDNHTVCIDHTCNVPEMITQDIQTITTDSGIQVYGYGVTNAVMAHEFGHSLGYVDLYSTITNRPGVGFFDIMDSGGSGMLGIAQNDTTYYVEGGLPVLPSAWHRILAWEDNFRARGILKDISELPLDQDITINPAEKKVSDIGATNPYFIKIPIDDKEYLLVENRQVDPDGDGGTFVKSTPDKRVILYPIHNNDDPADTLATYEYDFLLPGWTTQDNRFIGGGLLVWHIDNKIIYDEGNYDANTVNRDFYHRGVRLTEADNILDIGNIHSFYWLGTAYEPYYRFKPVLQNNFFVGWNNQTSSDGEEIGVFNDELSSSSKPPLQTNDDRSSYFSIYDISSYPIQNMQERTMTFKFGINHYDKTDRINLGTKKLLSIGPINKIGYIANEDAEFPIAYKDGLSIASYSNDEWLLFDVYDYKNISHISVFKYSDNADKYLITHKNKLEILGVTPLSTITYADSITQYPIYIKDTDEFAVSTNTKLYIGSDSLSYPNAKCFYNGEDIIVSYNGYVYFLNKTTHDIEVSYKIQNFDEKQDIVTFSDTLNNENTSSFILNKNGDVYKLTKENLTKIFSADHYISAIPSQLALFSGEDGYTYLSFAAGNKAFTISLNGTLKRHFPALLPYDVMPYSYPKVISENGLPFVYFDTDNDYIVAIGQDGMTYDEFSYIKQSDISQFGTPSGGSKSYFITTYPTNNLIVSTVNSDKRKMIWSGERTNNYSIFYGAYKEYQPVTNSKLDAYAFPNPAKTNYVNFRIFNATDKINLSIFNIAGDRLVEKNYPNKNEQYQDIPFDIGKYSSGVYFAMIKSGNKIKKLSFAVEK